MVDDVRWNLSQQVTLDLGRLLFGGLFRLRADGLDQIPRRGGCLLICSHPTLLDPVLLTLTMPRQAVTLAFAEPWAFAAAAYLLDLFQVIPMQRGRHAIRALHEAVRVVEEGRILIMFPEGRVSADGRLREFQPGAARLALTLGCPVIPAAVCGSYDAWPAGRSFPRFRPATVRFGAPLHFAASSESPAPERIDWISRRMRDAVAQLYSPLDPRASAAPPDW